MADIQPFPGIFYRVPDTELTRVLAPPYDVIPKAYQDELYGRDDRNIVRVVLNRLPGDEGYADAGATYAAWVKSGLLAPDATPALYVLEQKFTVEGQALTRLGLFARFRAEDAETGRILPHEQTRKAAKEDRWRVLQETKANFSPIFMMLADDGAAVEDRLRAIVTGKPDVVYTDDGGVLHHLFRVTDTGTIAFFRDALAKRKAYIADGHHRYATALRHRDATSPDGAWTLGYFTSIQDPGLIVLPYHRILSKGPTIAEAKERLAGRFLVNDAKSPADAAHQADQSTMPYAFGLAEPGGKAIVVEALPETEELLPADTPRSLRALDTYFLHKVVLGPILGIPDDAVDYVHSLAEAEESVAGGHCRLAVLLRPVPVRQIVDVSEEKQSMPAKSTFFYPKLPSGLVIHPLLA